MRRSLFLAVPAFLLLTACFGPETRAPVSHYGGSKGPGSAGIHTVVEGDTLYSISQRYKIVMRDIALSNDINAPFRLREGQRLRLPPPQEYRVREGDSLYIVSRLFGVNTSEIARTNNLSSPYVIRTGQVLRLPSVTRKAETTKLASISSPSPRGERAGVRGKETQGKNATPPHPNPLPEGRGDRKKVEARAKITAKTPKRSSGKFMRPVEGSVISTYGPKKDGLHNDGINIRAPKGSPVRAAENGVVVYAGSELKGSGNLVLVRHDGRWMTAYAHMDRTLIKRGDVIKRGQTIGTVGSTGSVDAPQLHFEVRRGTEAINPNVYLEG